MIKKLGIGIAFIASLANLYDMEVDAQKAKSEEIDHVKDLPNEVLAHIVSYVTGLREEQTVSGESKHNTLEKGLKEAKKDITSLSLTNKRLKELLDATNKKSWLHGQYKCELCPEEKPYTTAFYNALALHKLQKHICDKHICDKCNKAFTQYSYLIDHKRIHTGENPYKCDQCDRAFVTSSSFNKHKRIHAQDKPYICAICARAFVIRSDLNTHMHIHKQGNTYKRKLTLLQIAGNGRLGFFMEDYSDI
jgi:hypothetical protein